MDADGVSQAVQEAGSEHTQEPSNGQSGKSPVRDGDDVEMKETESSTAREEQERETNEELGKREESDENVCPSDHQPSSSPRQLVSVPPRAFSTPNTTQMPDVSVL